MFGCFQCFLARFLRSYTFGGPETGGNWSLVGRVRRGVRSHSWAPGWAVPARPCNPCDICMTNWVPLRRELCPLPPPPGVKPLNITHVCTTKLTVLE